MFYQRFLVTVSAASILAGCAKEAATDADTAVAVEDAAAAVEVADDVTAVTAPADVSPVQ